MRRTTVGLTILLLLSAPLLRAEESTRVYKGELDPIGPFQWPDMNGRVWTDNDVKGKVIVAQQWSAACGPCIDEFPQVQRLYKRLQKNDAVVFISLNMDRDLDALKQFLADFRTEYSFPVLFAGADLKIHAVPLTWIIDSDGYIRESFHCAPSQLVEHVLASVDRVKHLPAVSALPIEARDAAKKQNDAVTSR